MTNEIVIDDLSRVGGDTFKFEKVGDKLVGTITQVSPPFDRVNKFNGRNESVYPIGITPDGGDQRVIWPTRTDTGNSAMLQAIVDAVLRAGAKAYAIGGRLAVAYSEDKDTGKPQPMKLYAAKYEPPAAASVNVGADLFD
jgi:hypothetical protein